MIWDFYCAKCDKTEEHFTASRETVVVCMNFKVHDHPEPMKRCPGGYGMLFFEEGRQRTHWTLSNKPISSYKQQKALMKEHGVAEAGSAPPPRLMKTKRGPVKPEMKELCAAQKGRWI